MESVMIPRQLETTILDKLNTSKKGIIIYGPRQVGKTTLANKIISQLKLPTLVINGDGSKYIDILISRDPDRLKEMLSGYQVLFIDEAQRIPEIGVSLKIILDTVVDKKIIVTGSSALDLASKISEPLTGRIWSYKLLPISFFELIKLYNREELNLSLEERLRFGSYPEVFSYLSEQTRREYLQLLTDAYLYKDLLEFGSIKNSDKIRQLLKLLAFQIGSQVSLSELGNKLDLSKETVKSYLDLLEKSFVIFSLTGFSRNLRKEITKMSKYYFYDLGIRNILVDNTNLLSMRNDVGQLWENFLMIERYKTLICSGQLGSRYFWRTYTGAELDYVEEKDGKLSGFEFKWGNKKSRSASQWLSYYPESVCGLINRENYLDFLIPKNL